MNATILPAAMTTPVGDWRVLPPAEYAKLHGTELEPMAPVLPDSARVIVVEEDEQVVGCWALWPVYHVEGLWVRADRRHGRVLPTLIRAMCAVARSLGVRAVATASMSPEVTALLEHAGATELPGKHYLVRVR